MLQGDVSSGQFEAYFCVGDKVVAVATLGRDPVAADFANKISQGRTIRKIDIERN